MIKKIQFGLSGIMLACLISCGENSTTDSNTAFKQGHSLYEVYCGNCHAHDGQGLVGNIPPLANSDYLAERQSEMPCLMKKGLKGGILVNGKSYDGVMLGIGQLSDVEITNILNYINNEWGNKKPYVTIQEVGVWLKNCQ